jgi:hypothetical protein
MSAMRFHRSPLTLIPCQLHCLRPARAGCLNPSVSARVHVANQGALRTVASSSRSSSTPDFFTPLQPILINFFQSTLPKMATMSMNETLVTFLKNHAPNDAFAETDPVKASQDLFPEAAYTDSEKAEISQWLITASHLGSTVRSQCLGDLNSLLRPPTDSIDADRRRCEGGRTSLKPEHPPF